MKKIVFVVIIAALIIIFGVIIIQLSSKTGKVVLSTGGLKNSDDSKTESSEINPEETSEKVSGGDEEVGESAGGGVGGSGGTSEETTGKVTDTTPPTCDEQQISYAVRNFNFYSICNEYNENICNNKMVNCSAEIDNLDYETSGDFEIQFTFFDENRNEIETKSSLYLLEPRTSRLFEGIVELTSEGGNANKEISCSYATIKIPAIKVC